MNLKPIGLTHAHLINSRMISVCFSDGTATVLPVEDLLAYSPIRFPSDEECPTLPLSEVRVELDMGQGKWGLQRQAP